MSHVNLCCWDLKLPRNLYSKLKEGTGEPAIIIGISTIGLREASYFIVLPLCLGGCISELGNSHGPSFHMKVMRELIFLKMKKS